MTLRNKWTKSKPNLSKHMMKSLTLALNKKSSKIWKMSLKNKKTKLSSLKDRTLAFTRESLLSVSIPLDSIDKLHKRKKIKFANLYHI